VTRAQSDGAGPSTGGVGGMPLSRDKLACGNALLVFWGCNTERYLHCSCTMFQY
jgi:hypothetical protein